MLSFNIQSFCHCIFCLFFHKKCRILRFKIRSYNLWSHLLPTILRLNFDKLAWSGDQIGSLYGPKKILHTWVMARQLQNQQIHSLIFLFLSFGKPKLRWNIYWNKKQNKTKTLIFNVVPQIICQVKSTIDENHYSHTCKINSMSH